jgi:hypothetical protein
MVDESDAKRLKELRKESPVVYRRVKICLLIAVPVFFLFIVASIILMALDGFSLLWLVVMGPAIGGVIGGGIVLPLFPKIERQYKKIKDLKTLDSLLLRARVVTIIFYAFTLLYGFALVFLVIVFPLILQRR